jgi:hypothetical protein
MPLMDVESNTIQLIEFAACSCSDRSIHNEEEVRLRAFDRFHLCDMNRPNSMTRYLSHIGYGEIFRFRLISYPTNLLQYSDESDLVI